MAEMEIADPQKVATLASKIVGLLSPENSGTRRRVIEGALTMLGEAAPAGSVVGSKAIDVPKASSDEDTDLATFFNRGEKFKPSDTAFLCAAYHFSRYGQTAFSVDDLREIAADAGEVLPDRIDMTLRNAAKKGKKLFQLVGKNTFKPTASAAVYFRENWSVRPGKNKKSGEDQG